MITFRNRELAPPPLRRSLDDLAAAMPVGTAVRHRSGWTGVVAIDENASPGWPYDLTGGPDAHALTPSGIGVVCVTAQIGDVPVTAWYRASALTPYTPAPAAGRPARARVRGRVRRSSR